MADAALEQREQSTTAGGKDELDKFNWGAFLWTWVWALGHRLWVWALVGLIPLVGNLVLGFKGNRLAWEKNDYASKEEFRMKERKWVWAYLIFLVAWVALWIVAGVIGASAEDTSGA